MPHKQEIWQAAQRLVDAQQRSLSIGGLLDQTVTDQESQGEETLEDEQTLLSPPSLLSTRETDVS